LGVILGDIVFIGIAYLGSYRLIQSLKDKPFLFIYFDGIVLLLVYKKENKEIIRNKSSN
jgi:hypothetical protein